ncbi:MAG: hypothetical protein BGO01_19635 [Armatimonadetes bacterium 55-13]|nr:MAG: hypothetical protein BGO01_19635 [Armatimonadetes bacterium 55-13]
MFRLTWLWHIRLVPFVLVKISVQIVSFNFNFMKKKVQRLKVTPPALRLQVTTNLLFALSQPLKSLLSKFAQANISG